MKRLTIAYCKHKNMMGSLTKATLFITFTAIALFFFICESCTRFPSNYKKEKVSEIGILLFSSYPWQQYFFPIKNIDTTQTVTEIFLAEKMLKGFKLSGGMCERLFISEKLDDTIHLTDIRYPSMERKGFIYRAKIEYERIRQFDNDTIITHCFIVNHIDTTCIYFDERQNTLTRITPIGNY